MSVKIVFTLDDVLSKTTEKRFVLNHSVAQCASDCLGFYLSFQAADPNLMLFRVWFTILQKFMSITVNLAVGSQWLGTTESILITCSIYCKTGCRVVDFRTSSTPETTLMCRDVLVVAFFQEICTSQTWSKVILFCRCMKKCATFVSLITICSVPTYKGMIRKWDPMIEVWAWPSSITCCSRRAAQSIKIHIP